MAMKKGYLCEDGKHLNITGENIEGLYDEPYLSSVEWIGVIEIADKVKLDYSIFKNLKEIMIIPDVFNHSPNLTDLDLAAMGIDFLPPSVFQLPGLKRLDVRGNNLSEECLDDLRKRGVNVYS